MASRADPAAPGLLQRWVALLGPASRDDGQALLERYAEPHRGYHDARHLVELLAALDLLAGRPPAAVALAGFWHDAVYDPTAADNEERSAAEAARVLTRLGRPGTEVAEVVRLVRLTAGHQPAPGDAAGALLCDADLAVLAAPDERYADYTAGVRREYAHLDDEAFRQGRAAVLRTLLARPALYATADGRRRWERTARRHLTDELADLAG